MEPDSAQLLRYLSGESTSADLTTIHGWASSDVRHRDELDALTRLWRLTPEVAPVEPVPHVWAAIQERMLMNPGLAASAKVNTLNIAVRQSPRSVAVSPWQRVLAVMTVIAVVLGYGIGHSHTNADRFTQQYHTAPGQQALLHLADGTQIRLAPATSIGIDENAVTLSGEAYFTASNHPRHPLMVRTQNTTVQVLGTQFSVRQYSTDAMSRVVVDEGRITLGTTRRPSSDRITLSARMLAFVSDSGVTVTPGIVAREYTSWTRGPLVFNHTPIREVIAELARSYGVDIRVADSTLASKTFVAEVDVATKQLTQILDAICYVADASYVRDGRAFVLSRGHRDHRIPGDTSSRQMLSQPEKSYGR